MKKLICVLLSVAMLIGVCVPATAQAPEHSPEACDTLPVIVIRGMDLSAIYLDYGTENQRSALISTTPLAVVSFGFYALSQVFLNPSLDNIMKVVFTGVGGLFDGLAMNPDGTSKHNVGTKQYTLSAGNYEELLAGEGNEPAIARSCIEAFGGDHTYYFNYDCRLDPLTVADDIHALVETAVRETGHSKVKIVNASMGGMMTVAYLTKYGYDRVERCIFLSSTFCGSHMASDLLCGRVKFNADNLSNLLLKVTDNNSAIKLLSAIGAFKLIGSLGDKIAENYLDVLNEVFLVPVFGYMLSMWGLVLPEDYEAAINKVFGGRTAENAAFLAKTDALQAMMAGRNKLLDDMLADGVKIAVVAAYNSPVIPVYESADLTGDMILETELMTGFATVAKYGQTLGDDYVAQNAKYLSPDRCVDLSTAILRDYTYVIKDAPHVSGSYGTDYNAFILWLLSYDGNNFAAGVNPAYPRFMLSGNDQSLSAA